MNEKIAATWIKKAGKTWYWQLRLRNGQLMGETGYASFPAAATALDRAVEIIEEMPNTIKAESTESTT